MRAGHWADLSLNFAVRDNWEVKVPELEANLSSTMGVPWKISVDPGYIYSFAEDRYAKESTGKMLTKCDLLPLAIDPATITLIPSSLLQIHYER